MIIPCHESHGFLPLLCFSIKSQSTAISCLRRHLTLCQKAWGCMQEQSFSVGLGARFAWCHCWLCVAAHERAIKHTLSRSATDLTICIQFLFLLCCTFAVCTKPMSTLCDLSWRRPILPAVVRNAVAVAEMAQYSSGVPGDRHHLKGVPLLMGDDVSLVNITISQKPDGSDWLLGQGSSGKVFHHHCCCH